MSERRAWTEEQDNALKYLKDTLQVKKWSQISRRLEFEFNLPGRNGKQCRQRYTNHLDSSIISKGFTEEDEEKLFRLHDKIGNRWSLISKQLAGRTDNHIKNHFHSKLRKGIRKLNKQIKQHFKKSIKPYKLNIIYKIVETSDYRFNQKVTLDEENLLSFNQLKNIILQYAGGMVQRTELSSMKNKEQVQFIVSKLQTLEKYLKNKKISAKSEKNSSNSGEQKFNNSVQNDSTSNSESCSQNEKDNMVQQEEEQDDIYEDGSFQFITQGNQVSDSPKFAQMNIQNLNEAGNLQKKDSQVQQMVLEGSSFYSFFKNQKQHYEESRKFDNIPIGLIQQTELPMMRLSKKFSLKSFQSLKEYEDSMNQSEFQFLMKRFESCSDIEQGLFE